ncbi:UDP-N-acetylglucosamine--N-acetylmuramyl-(pentapeptide) pyrophosphoryl-undecaprenol N-acetylglucosamine transferase [Corynebacterium sp. HMSC067D03]|uniref:UDP-N-acetylglucosamine--N-acetylmuramyl- (pentapeptide) pyrophosphoryl-undecaprenol N-acetylglucosamine transferase n=1 Tax=unclassified Corynebacterium TaxID=2624378 RepID=UPI0008A35AFB|nr:MULTISPECIES: UDP-N-acetylglucosamine--N-acetylmuramyl-(pentapeptide) pyrophosphoryl-undecaprenol N-acetylglucosamine transferase [unclassified Corynebacterium]OFL17868.1 UDP-N-acetylglucosamine--N-acetylmuramyl-(pentapeptide) pyrophosphoryl-undecaprenol N-acetylglucosamine transferase [Corynebacterium sp. HMSC067D03]OFL93135.1 UDP-N-acetylglucosamine--N-acetylmuramyl-(pentapeptide) pyrophosphoryl-undecaprenol N-acetylglucosamine transferase [Corynebacterium sp. HMSC055D05]OHO34074.1 UDP-N-ac
MSELNVVLAGGGTAGHIEPALAVGEVLRDQFGANVVALGTERGLETTIVPARGFQLALIDPVPIPRKKPWKLAAVPAKLLRSVNQAKEAMKSSGAQVVLGTGGYVSAPAYLAAKSLRLPFFVLETNALAGMANKLGVKLGGVGLNAVANSGMAGDVVGIPVRPGVGVDPDGAKRERGLRTWGLDPEKTTVLVTGGSQGAVSINTALAGAVERITAAGHQVLHAYGRKNDAPAPHEGYTAVPYIDDMEAAYAVADVVVCRSGAMTVAENSAAGVPAIYIPLPHGNGEQGLNSAHLVATGAALRIDDAELNGDVLVEKLLPLLNNDDARAEMRRAIAQSGAGNVAEDLARRIADAAGKEN